MWRSGTSDPWSVPTTNHGTSNGNGRVRFWRQRLRKRLHVGWDIAVSWILQIRQNKIFTLLITVRIDAISHDTTHTANIGQNNPILFSLPLRAGQPPAFALRSDVDVCVWLPITRPSIDPTANVRSELQFRHEGTLNAFGYIQASKQQKKYIQCAPDFSYSIVCEPHRHIFIYKGAYESASGLKNRNSSEKVSIGQQKLVTMDEADEVVGLICENEVTMLLTQRQILCLQIKS